MEQNKAEKSKSAPRRCIEKAGKSAGLFLKRTFSITEDAASHEEIRDRLLSGGKVTGTNMCVMV